MDEFRDLIKQENLLRGAIKNFDAKEESFILKALELAKEAHNGQKRDEGDPYIIHPIRAAYTLINNLGVSDCNLICACLLHDVVEDTAVLLEEIERDFGERVADLVGFVTRGKEETKRDKFEKTIRASQEVKMVKVCDWLDNLRSCVYRTDRGERWQRHLQEDKEMYLPLAENIGDQWLIKEMNKAYKAVLKINGENYEK